MRIATAGEIQKNLGEILRGAIDLKGKPISRIVIEDREERVEPCTVAVNN
jgi:hypothetical protein